MADKKNIFALIGSASTHSANEKLIEYFADLTRDVFCVTIFTGLKTLPHFDPVLSVENPPREIVDFRKKIAQADGIIICTPEYIFSLPSGLKNAIEWCVSTTIFSNKPTGLITASAQGQKGQAELQLIMKTLMADFTDETTLLIQGIKGRVDEQGQINDEPTKKAFFQFIDAFKKKIFSTHD